MLPARFAYACALAALLAGVAVPAAGFDVSGSARLWAGSLETEDRESDQLDQKYSLNLSQTVSPWLRLTLSFRHDEQEEELEQGDLFRRRSSEPSLVLAYDRPLFSARFQILERELRSSVAAQNLDIESRIGQMEWRPRSDLRTILRYQDESNVADVSVFGRDTESEAIDWTTLLQRRNWSGRYTFRDSTLDNSASGLSLEEERHELRLDYNQRLWSDRLFLSADGLVGRTDQQRVFPLTGELAQPVAARRGLFAVDTSPAIGELESEPQLIDGDLETPVEPRIEIGGGSTFRNIGVDLGISRPVTRLEISVDSPSDTGLVWELYHGPDNLSWTRVEGVVSEFDQSFLRYTLRFPETAGRYFKAVNVSGNSQARVAVTEIRALLDVTELGRGEAEATIYRASLFASYHASDRVNLTLGANIRNDEDLAGALVSRDLEESNLRGGVEILLSPTLTWHFGFNLNDFEERVGTVLRREEEILSTGLEWDPLETVGVALTGSSREERDGEMLVRSTDSVRLRALTELLPDLSVTSELSWSDTQDPFFGLEQSSWRWVESFDSRPTSRWQLGGLFSYARYDTTGVVSLTRRNQAALTTRYALTPFLSLGGSWDYADDDRQETLDQRYNLAWAPGRKLAVSASFQKTETDTVRETTTSAGTLTYRHNRWFTIWSGVSSSRFDQADLGNTRNRSARVGMNLLF